jgi:hypothetical protein
MVGYKNGLMVVVNQSSVFRNIDLSYKWVSNTIINNIYHCYIIVYEILYQEKLLGDV